MNFSNANSVRLIIINRIQKLIRFYSIYNLKTPPKRFNPFSKKKFVNLDEVESKIATRVCITVLGNGAFGQPRCVALFTEFKGYVFNCGEGIGRICREHEINMCALRNIFITQKLWRNMSGLPDIYLTHKAFGVSKIALYGPPGIEHFTSVISAVDLDVAFSNKSYSKNSYVDDTLEVKCVQIKDQAYLGGATEGEVCFSYICRIFEKAGELNPEKCVEFGVPIGPELLELKKGQDVKLPSGKIIRSSDVHDAPYAGTVFLVVDCPSVEFLESFINEKAFIKYQFPSDTSSDVSAVFHFSPPDIVKSIKYQEWIHKFHQNVQHFILNSDNSTVSSKAVQQTQHVLNLLHPNVFSLLKEKENASEVFLNSSCSVIQSPPMLQLYIRPEKKLCWSNVVTLDYNDYIQMVKSLPSIDEKLKKLKSAVIKNQILSNLSKKYPEVVFLGTGSSTSSAFRNVSAILVNINSSKSVLLDCGEGALMQFVRYYGANDVNSVLKNISCIFISHKHTDHYLGLFEIIKARVEAFEKSNEIYEPLALILPKQIYEIFNRFNKAFECLSSKVRTYSCNFLKAGGERKMYLSKFLGNVELETVLVEHCYDAYGAVLNLGSEWKIVYSGDTAPSQRLIEAGKDCTLLIHEASIEDGMLNEASFKKHSTPSQVVEISEMMNAQYTIMTHFSKRYLAVPVFDECSNRHIACSFDFMKVQLSDLPLLPLFLPAMKDLFQEQLESHSERTKYVTSFENVLLKTLKS